MKTMVARMWKFLSVPANLAICVFFAGGIAWAVKEVAQPLMAKKAVPVGTVDQRANAVGGSAINAADSARVLINSSAAESQSHSHRRGSAVSQGASASTGGMAINASDSAEVKISDGVERK